ncbi:hypothetical protein [Myceligenerans indicum]|uniref:Uncharacterized protein n=1 Tax=Myceligenerans indicum TaxID=2593663 RepID=A0ABS1LFB3_9MICO|nr:hypothetical protein [Myceligenerans indicum]MBL0884873.1 hypothetical protein [Myceligenerans indicum]
MTTQAAAPEPSGIGAPAVRTDAVTTSVTTVGVFVRGRVLGRFLAGAAILAIVTALLVGWVNQARAATTDRLEALTEQIDVRVTAGRTGAERLATVIVVARNVQADSAGADPDARAMLDAAIRSAEGVVGQRVTTQEPATVPQAEMLVEQAGLVEESLTLATTDLRTAVDRVRLSTGDPRSPAPRPAAQDEQRGIFVAVAGP